MKEQTASSTAETMTMHRAFEAFFPKDAQVIQDPHAAHFISEKTRKTLNSFLGRCLIRFVMNRVYPGVNGAVVSRVRFIDEIVAAGLKEDLKQVVILGAGYDTRAFRLGLEKIRVFELDHPATQERKKQKVKELFKALPNHVTYIPVDLEADGLAPLLNNTAYDPIKRTLFIMEGLLMYLPKETVTGLLTAARDNSAKGSGVTFDYLPTTLVDGTIKVKEGKNMHKHVLKTGEPFHFGLNPDRVEPFLGELGWTVTENIHAPDCRNRYFNGSGTNRKISTVFSFVHAISHG